MIAARSGIVLSARAGVGARFILSVPTLVPAIAIAAIVAVLSAAVASARLPAQARAIALPDLPAAARQVALLLLASTRGFTLALLALATPVIVRRHIHSISEKGDPMVGRPQSRRPSVRRVCDPRPAP